ncbi:MAG TPA: hypothetical protein PKB09_02820 [Candidatus Saccharibacteria bacterium]|nr:hypothetical protein [Candidatus Saccharibacteria bacterium]
MSEGMPRKVIGPDREDIARAQSDYIDPMTMGILKLSSSEEHGSPTLRRALGAGVVAGALSQNGAASSAIAPVGITEDLPNVHAAPTGEWLAQDAEFSTNPQEMQVQDGKLKLRINNEYRRGFTANAEDAVDSADQINELIDQNRDRLSNPDLIEEVDLTGLVSANDNRENLGEEGVIELQTPGPDLDGNGETEQVKLARERYEKAKESLVERIQDEFGYDISDKIKPFDPAVDTHEDSFTDTEVAKAEELREKYKERFDSVEQMIDYFEGNFGTPRDVPNDVARFLDRAIAREQGAKIVITLKDEKPPLPPIGKEAPVTPVMAQMVPGFIPVEPSLRRKGWDRKVEDDKGGRLPDGHFSVAHRQKQPRNHNFSKNRQAGRGLKGRMARTHGGNRRSKRG